MLNENIEGNIKEEDRAAPEWFLNIQNAEFSYLSDDEKSEFIANLSEATPSGINFEPIRWKLCSFILKELIDIVDNQDISYPLKTLVSKSINKVLKTYESAIDMSKLCENSIKECVEETYIASKIAQGIGNELHDIDKLLQLKIQPVAEASYASQYAAAGRMVSLIDRAAATVRMVVETAASIEGLEWEVIRLKSVPKRTEAFKRYFAELIRLLKDAGTA